MINTSKNAQITNKYINKYSKIVRYYRNRSDTKLNWNQIGLNKNMKKESKITWKNLVYYFLIKTNYLHNKIK